MAWETRRGRAYLYRTHRLPGGGWYREYLGRGPVAEAWAAELERERLKRDQAREAWRRGRETMERMDQDLAALCGEVETLARASLLAAGFHKHGGQWRRRRKHDR